MQYLCDKSGRRVAYIRRARSSRFNIHLLDGQPIAEIDDNFVYNNDADHIGWRNKLHIYNRSCEIVLLLQSKELADETPPYSFERRRTVKRAQRMTARPMPFSFKSSWATIHGLPFLEAGVSTRPIAAH